tara:strand:+ start:31 stop:882 length:852 start_codon:yes stop_codon:yes gene_type:complete
MSRLLLLRLNFLSLKTLINTKTNLIINFSIFIIVFALTASCVSILFENRIEELETRIIKNEVNHILYSKWINKAPKTINRIDNVKQNRKNDELFSDIIKLLPDDKDEQTSTLYSNRDEYLYYIHFLSDVVSNNFRNMDLALTDAILLANTEKDIRNIIAQKNNFLNLINDFDKYWYERWEYKNSRDDNNSFKENQLHYLHYSHFVKKNFEILKKQKIFFSDFVTKYFSNKRDFFNKKNLEDLKEINELAYLETRFIFFAFVIQFIIFIILQIFEITIERQRKK